MGFIQPSPPPFDLEEWRAKPYLTRLKLNCQDWAVNGFAPPGAVYLLYVVKLVLFVFLGLLIVSLTTPGVGGLGDISEWWTKPIVFQKLYQTNANTVGGGGPVLTGPGFVDKNNADTVAKLAGEGTR